MVVGTGPIVYREASIEEADDGRAANLAALRLRKSVAQESDCRGMRLAIDGQIKSRNAREEGDIALRRNPADFATGFVPGSLNIGLNGDFAVWAGTLIAPNANILLVTEPGREIEAIERLSRIGYDHVAGYLKGGFEAWHSSDKPGDHVNIITASDIQDLQNTSDYALIDVRNRKEAAKDRMTGAVHIPLNELAAKADTLHKEHKWLVYCAGGYRSMIAASFLKLQGFHNVASVEGGIANVRKTAPELIELGMETE